MIRDRGLFDVCSTLNIEVEVLVDWLLNKVFLDLGSGLEQFLLELIDYIGDHNGLIVGLDILPCREIRNVLKANFSNIPLASNSVERILCCFTLGVYAEGEDELKAQVKELYRVLAPGGQCYMVLIQTITNDTEVKLYSYDRSSSCTVDLESHLANVGLVTITRKVEQDSFRRLVLLVEKPVKSNL